MNIEIEAKWLNIDKDQIRAHLQACSAELVHEERTMRRRNYDYPDGRLDITRNGWIRVRDEGNKVTLSYKQLDDRTVTGMKEVTVEVGSFEAACSFLESVGFHCFTVQETLRESWLLDGSEVEIDTWPWIPSFVEIESSDEASLQRVAQKLGLDYEEALFGSVEIAYQAVYDVTEAEVNDWGTIVFSDVPNWLEAKRKAQ